MGADHSPVLAGGWPGFAITVSEAGFGGLQADAWLVSRFTRATLPDHVKGQAKSTAHLLRSRILSDKKRLAGRPLTADGNSVLDLDVEAARILRGGLFNNM